MSCNNNLPGTAASSEPPELDSEASAPSSVEPSAPASAEASAPPSVEPSAPASAEASAPPSVEPSAPASELSVLASSEPPEIYQYYVNHITYS